tara:strand:- start:10 stop:606 length:597 start_codon:yes stop_codon:yes gene_type:complete
MNKKGQFFLIAAFVIITALISLRAVYVIAESSIEDSTLKSLTTEAEFESIQIIDSNIFSARKSEIPTKVNELSQIYSKLNPDKDILFLVGDRSSMKLYYKDTTGDFESLSITGASINNLVESIASEDIGAGSIIGPGGTEITLIPPRRFEALVFPYEDSEEITVTIGDLERTFELQEGQNFYIVIKKQKDGEKIVTSN